MAEYLSGEMLATGAEGRGFDSEFNLQHLEQQQFRRRYLPELLSEVRQVLIKEAVTALPLPINVRNTKSIR